MPQTAAYTIVYPSQVTWNNNTWTKALGGPVSVAFTHEGTPIEDRTGSAEYAMSVVVVDKSCRAEVTLREPCDNTALGTKSDLVFTGTGKATATITLTGMVFVGYGSNIDRATPANRVMRFVHESADGTTVPVSGSYA